MIGILRACRTLGATSFGELLIRCRDNPSMNRNREKFGTTQLPTPEKKNAAARIAYRIAANIATYGRSERATQRTDSGCTDRNEVIKYAALLIAIARLNQHSQRIREYAQRYSPRSRQRDSLVFVVATSLRRRKSRSIRSDATRRESRHGKKAVRT